MQHDLDKDRTNVFVKYLPPEIDSAGLHKLFETFGKIVSAKVMENQDTGQSLGYGFVRFTHPKEAKNAICSMAGKRLNNKILLCRLSNNLAFTEPSTNLYIKPLPPDMNEGQLKEWFGKHGAIATVKIVSEKNSPNTRIGFVRYENVECASKAIEERNGTKLAPDLSPLIVKYAESEEKRALRKAHALPKHIAKSAAYQTTNNINTNVNSPRNSNFTGSSAPNSKFPPRYATSILPYEQYMTPYDVPLENVQEWTYLPSLASPTYTEHGVGVGVGGGPPFGNSYQVMLVPYVEGMPFAVYPPRYMPNTMYY